VFHFVGAIGLPGAEVRQEVAGLGIADHVDRFGLIGPFVADRAGEMGGGCLEVLVRRRALGRRDPSRKRGNVPFIQDDDLGVARLGLAERVVDGLGRSGVVPDVLDRFLVRIGGVGGVRRCVVLGRGGRLLRTDLDVRCGRGPLGLALGLVPVDVLDRSEELIQILEEVLAVALVVGHLDLHQLLLLVALDLVDLGHEAIGELL
jgi:hypothetical protein